jgi:hypothetical protein
MPCAGEAFQGTLHFFEVPFAKIESVSLAPIAE